MSEDKLIPIGAVIRGIDPAADPLRDGDRVDEYRPVEPSAAMRLRPSRRPWTVDPHSLAIPKDLESSRTIERLYCDCRSPGMLLRTVACSDGLVWAIIEPQRIPAAVRLDEHDDGRNKWVTPLHCSPDGHPHVSVTSCKRCGRNWLVLLWDDVVETVKLKLVRHGLRVVDDRTP